MNTAITGHRYCIAPMMDWTDKHDRYFLRLITQHARLYTEMVTTQALMFGDVDYLLGYNPQEHPLALQLGGCDPEALAHCAKLAQEYGYDEVNLNVGCPSERVQKGAFGACLMAEPELVAQCVSAMKSACGLPITVKTRIGIDHDDNEAFLLNFLDHIYRANVDAVIIHARKAWLSGLSPKENREIPPLDYPRVHAVKDRWPDLPVIINGGINTLDQAHTQLSHGLDGVMVGRAAYKNPYLLAQVDATFFNNDAPAPSRLQLIEKYMPYMSNFVASGQPLKRITRHLTGLYQGCPGARLWRRTLSDTPELTPEKVLKTAQQIEATVQGTPVK